MGVGAFYEDAAATLHSTPWELLTLQEGGAPGEVTAWVLLGSHAGFTLHSIPIEVPRTVYVAMSAPHEHPGWLRVQRKLPRDAQAAFLYEVSLPESEFRASHGDASRWLEVPNVEAVYHTAYSPLLRAATQLGNCCTVHRGTPRRSARDACFGRTELQDGRKKKAVP